MPRLKDVLTERGQDVFVKVELGASADKFDYKSGNTYHIKLAVEDIGESDEALEAFITKELKGVGAHISGGRGSREKKVYISAH